MLSHFMLSFRFKMFLVPFSGWHELAVNRNLLACVKFASHIPLGKEWREFRTVISFDCGNVDISLSSIQTSSQIS